jgi:hypothetical protein
MTPQLSIPPCLGLAGYPPARETLKFKSGDRPPTPPQPHHVAPERPPTRSSNSRCVCRTTRPAEVDHIRERRASWLRLYTLLRGDVQVVGPAGDEALAVARR